MENFYRGRGTLSRLHLIRHGQASFGDGDYDRLSDLGLRQARMTGRGLKESGWRPDAAYSGDLARQRDTARAVLAGLASPPRLQVLAGFNEFDSGPIIRNLLPAMAEEDPAVKRALPEMYRDRRAFQVIYDGAMRRWVSGQYPDNGVESWPAFLQRVGAALERVRAENQGGKNVLVFTSGGPIAAAMRLVMGLEDLTALKLTWVIKNASLSTFLYNDREMTLDLFNSTAHLEGPGRNGLITYR